jgi:hypothetical protein
MRRKIVDSRHGPVTVISGDELKNRQPATEGFLAPKGVRVSVSSNYYDEKKNLITITDTELFALAKASADKLTPRERQALALFRVQITRGDELSERQQGFLYDLIEKCRDPVKKKTMLSPEEFEQRKTIRNALLAMLNKNATPEQTGIVFSDESLTKAREELTGILTGITILSKDGKTASTENVVSAVMVYILARIGYSNTHVFLIDSAEKQFKLFFRKEVQESAISDARKNLRDFPSALQTALKDHPNRMSYAALVDVIDGMYISLLSSDTSFTKSSVTTLKGGLPGMGKRN